MATSTLTNRYFPALTGVRAIAAWMVFVHHFNPFDRTNSPWLHNVSHVMHTGVSVFFVLSGFLIWHRYHESKQWSSWRGYFQNRFARIFPLYFVLTSLTFLTTSDSVSEFLPTYLLNITLLKGYFAELLFTGISQGWTLTVEETFYLLAPLMMVLLHPGRSLPLRALAVIAGALATGYLLVLLVGDVLPFGFMKDWKLLFTYTFFGRCTEFVAGMILAVVYARHRGRLKLIASPLWLIPAGLILFAMASFAYTDTELVLNNFLLPLAIALVFAHLITRESVAVHVLSSRAMQLFGRSSYAFYLVHIGVIQVWLTQSVSDHTILLFVLLNAVAIGLYYGIEKPFRQMLHAKD